MKKSTAQAATNKSALHDEIQRLAEAMMSGRLDDRGNISLFSGEDADVITIVNRMLDTLVAPLRLAAGAIDEIAHGRIPPFIIDEYEGEHNTLKRNLNTLLATLFGLHSETQHLIGNIGRGNLRTRGNDWDFNGIWRDLISGVNGTLDAVTHPVEEASSVLKRLAAYDLSARMGGRYHGEHAAIKKATNATAESLHSAVSQVVETVALVSDLGNTISQGSEKVSLGAQEQETQLAEAAKVLEHVAEASQKSALDTADAQKTALAAADTISNVKTAMDEMVSSMKEIRASADNTATIVQQIDSIAKETETLSSTATSKATLVRSSANGFSVVATEVRRLSEKCEESVAKLKDFHRRVRFLPASGGDVVDEALLTEYFDLMRDLKTFATNASLLGVNASISAAHVEGAGNDFEQLTEEIRGLAQRTAQAARQTDSLIQASMEQVRRGEGLSQTIDSNLAKAVTGASTIRTLTDEISQNSQTQASAIEEVSRSVIQINDVTRQNAACAVESSEATKSLGQQMTKLTKMVTKFKLHGIPQSN